MFEGYKGLGGSIKACEDSRHNAEYMVYTMQEHLQKERLINALYKQINEMEVAAEQEYHKSTAQLAELQKKLESAVKRADLYEGLNQNLKRICTERANSDRKLVPKKEHTGYILLKSERGTRVENGSKMDAWKTTVQTPYSVILEDDQIRKLVKEDLVAKKVVHGIKGRGGMVYNNFKTIKDFKSGYWSVVLDSDTEIIP